jgi:hypothetical protein
MPQGYKGDTVDFSDVTVEHETYPGDPDNGALLCIIQGEKKWVPKSQIGDDSELKPTTKEEPELVKDGTLTVTRWWAEKNGLGG